MGKKTRHPRPQAAHQHETVDTQHLKLDPRGDGMYSGTFRWLETKRFLELPVRSAPLEPSTLTGGWGKLLAARSDAHTKLADLAAQDPSCLDALSFPVTLAHTAQQLGLWHQSDIEKHVLVIGASCKAEQRVWRITDYWHELLHFFPRTEITLWFIGPEALVDGQEKLSAKQNSRLRARHFRGTFGNFQDAHASHECTPENTIIVGFNTGFGNFVDSNHFALLFSWLPDLYRIADSRIPAIFTCANDYADMNGEFAVQSRIIGADMLLLPQQNPFSCASHLHEEGQRDTAWSRGNSFLYAIRGCDPERRVHLAPGDTATLQKRLDADLDLHLEDALGRHFYRGTVLSKEQAARCKAIQERKASSSSRKASSSASAESTSSERISSETYERPNLQLLPSPWSDREVLALVHIPKVLSPMELWTATLSDSTLNVLFPGKYELHERLPFEAEDARVVFALPFLHVILTRK